MSRKLLTNRRFEDRLWDSIFHQIGRINNEYPFVVRNTKNCVTLDANLMFHDNINSVFTLFLTKCVKDLDCRYIYELDYNHDCYKLLLSNDESLYLWPNSACDYHVYYLSDENFIFYHPWTNCVHFFGPVVIQNVGMLDDKKYTYFKHILQKNEEPFLNFSFCSNSYIERYIISSQWSEEMKIVSKNYNLNYWIEEQKIINRANLKQLFINLTMHPTQTETSHLVVELREIIRQQLKAFPNVSFVIEKI